ncbi:MAG: 6,7-dimethyl-8-ribityllumazine synthase [Legionella sp.]
MQHITGIVDGKQNTFPIAIIVSRFNQSITQELLSGSLSRLKDINFPEKKITVIEVPGAIEIPLVAKYLARAKQHNIIIALGAVIRGETSHYDYVCQQVSDGCQRVALEFDIPVIFKVLTTENEEQAWDRLGGKHGHAGIDAVDCAITMYNVFEQLSLCNPT